MHQSLISVVCAFAVVSHPGSVAAGERASAVASRERGLTLGYNLDHAAALDAFREAIAADPDDPTTYPLLAGAAWVALLFEQGIITVDDYLGQARSTLARAAPNAALDATFHDALRRARSLSEERLRRNPDDAEAHYLVGAADGFLASYAATVEGRVLGSLGPARRAYREHERVLELDPARKDAGLIVGLYRYGVASLPAPLRLLAHLAGFGSGRERGLRLVEDASRYPSHVQSNALFMLVLLYNREARYDDALHVIVELQSRYPRNRLLWLEAGGTALRAGRPAVAKGDAGGRPRPASRSTPVLAPPAKRRAGATRTARRWARSTIRMPPTASCAWRSRSPRATGSVDAFTKSLASSPTVPATVWRLETSIAWRIGCAGPITIPSARMTSSGSMR